MNDPRHIFLRKGDTRLFSFFKTTVYLSDIYNSSLLDWVPRYLARLGITSLIVKSCTMRLVIGDCIDAVCFELRSETSIRQIFEIGVLGGIMDGFDR